MRCLFAFLAVYLISHTAAEERTVEENNVRVLFGFTAAHLINDQLYGILLKEVDDESPLSDDDILAFDLSPSGRFGFLMSIIYLLRNLRLAISFTPVPEFYRKIDSPEIARILNRDSLYAVEMDLFNQFYQWNANSGDSHKQSQLFVAFVRTLRRHLVPFKKLMYATDFGDFPHMSYVGVEQFAGEGNHRYGLKFHTYDWVNLPPSLLWSDSCPLPVSFEREDVCQFKLLHSANTGVPLIDLTALGHSPPPKLQLSHGRESLSVPKPVLPLIGFGTMISHSVLPDALRIALLAGYRLIDTSENYNNEEAIGQVLAEVMGDGIPLNDGSGKVLKLKRDELYVATKLSFLENYGTKTRDAFFASLKRLGLEYVDVYMTHGTHRDAAIMRETWQQMEALFDEGFIRVGIAISNYGANDIDSLMRYARIKPLFVQNKFDPFTLGSQAPWLSPNPLHVATNRYGILLQGYSSINAWPHFLSSVRNLPQIGFIARKHKVSSAQVVVRWALQMAVPLLVSSGNAQHIADDIDVFHFQLSDAEIKVINLQQTLFSPFSCDFIQDIYGVHRS